MGSKGFREHGLRIYLNVPLYKGFIKLQGDKELGRSYAGLLAFTIGLYELGYLSKSNFLRLKQKYNTPLDKEPQQLTLADTPKQNELNELNEDFGKVVAQWNFHPEQAWRDEWIKRAIQNGDLPNAKKLLAFVEERKTK